MFRPPYDLPGTSIHDPHKPGEKICPHCGCVYIKVLIVKVDGKEKHLCPYCKQPVS